MTDIERIVEVLKDFCINDYNVSNDEKEIKFKVNVFNCKIQINDDETYEIFAQSSDSIIDDKNKENIDKFLQRLRSRIKFMQQYQDVYSEFINADSNDKEALKMSCEKFMDFLHDQFK